MRDRATATDVTGRIGRRNLLRAVGAGAAGSVAVSWPAAAHEAECVFFCGCGRMVAYGDLPVEENEQGGPANPILVAKEGGGPGRPELSYHQGKNDDEDNLEFTNRGRGKILALVVFDPHRREIWFNPNQCAENVFDEYETGTYRDKYHDTVVQGFGEDYSDHWEEFTTTAGRKGHCHPPRDHPHEHC